MGHGRRSILASSNHRICRAGEAQKGWGGSARASVVVVVPTAATVKAPPIELFWRPLLGGGMRIGEHEVQALLVRGKSRRPIGHLPKQDCGGGIGDERGF